MKVRRDVSGRRAPLRAWLIAPPVAPALYWLSTLAFALADSDRRESVLGQALSGLGVIMAFGVPIAVVARRSGPACGVGRRERERVVPTGR